MEEITDVKYMQKQAHEFLETMNDLTANNHPEMTNPTVNPVNDNTDAGKSTVGWNMPNEAASLKM